MDLFVSDCLRVVASDLARLAGSVIVGFERREFEKNGHLFLLAGHDYRFEASISNGSIALQRNEQALTLHVYPFEPPEVITIFIEWSPEVLRLSYAIIPSRSLEVDREVELRTRYTSPPQALLHLLKKANLVETIDYASENAFHLKVLSILNSLEAKLQEMRSMNAFWNLTYDGNRIKTRSPKREPDIHPVVEGLLSDQMLMSSIEVVGEYATGIGRLDFMLIGHVHNTGFHRFCVEVKTAHSPDLLHGLFTQLPSYMENKTVGAGAYLILWYGKPPAGSSATTGLELLSWVISQSLIRMRTDLLKRIRVFLIDLTASDSASKFGRRDDWKKPP